MRRVRDSDEDEDDDDIPLHYKQAFGTGLKRKRIEFVPAREEGSATKNHSSKTSDQAVADLYASIVLGSESTRLPVASLPSTATAIQAEVILQDDASALPTCAVCSLPVTSSIEEHESSLAHQVSVAHSHPPSALDRSRMGFRTLTSKGWDPDARVGLGKEGEGLRYPIKVASKEDNLGIGAAEEARRLEEERKSGKTKVKAVEQPVKTLTAKEMIALDVKERKKGEKLQAEIFGRVDLDKYLSRGEEWE